MNPINKTIDTSILNSYLIFSNLYPFIRLNAFTPHSFSIDKIINRLKIIGWYEIVGESR